MTLEIRRVEVLQGFGPDEITIETNLPNGAHPYIGPATAVIKVANGKGEEYVLKHFPDYQFTITYRDGTTKKGGTQRKSSSRS